MGITCDCSVYLGDYDGPSCQTKTLRKAAKPHRCVECDKEIAKGETYEETTGVWDGTPDRFRTCVSCQYLRDTYCANGFIFGDLYEQLEECARDKMGGGEW
jgi:hypothetical protein